jgi:2-desacetyl-2-hydroxyethyl bacteriochlorophyllide A dehydrogenase
VGAGEKTGRAAVLRGPLEVEIRRREVRPPSTGDAVVQVQASGICSTDVEIYRGNTAVAPGRVLGHEGAGVVLDAPPGSGLEPRVPVVVDPTIACGRCPVCREGLPNLCPRGGLLGRELDGVFADEIAVPAANLHALPAELEVADAPLLQVLATVVHAHEAVRVVPGRVAAVVGLGCTGQLHAQLLAHRGARVLGVTRSADKRALAAELACEWTAPPAGAHALAQELDPRGGADLVVESAGTVETLELALQLVRPGGTVLAYGSITASSGDLSFYQIYKKEVRIVGARSSLPRDMEIAITLVATGAVRLAPLVTDRLPLEAAAEALERSAAGSLKVLMEHR